MGLVRRYSHVAALATALAGGALVARFRERWPSRRAGLAVGALLLVGMLPSFSHLAETWESRLPDPMRLGLLGPRGALTWLREKTPPTSHFLDPRSTPEYGILAEWDMGSLVEQVAERPVVATEFGWETHGFYEENVFMASTEPSIAERILDENRVRYVLVRARFSSRIRSAIDGSVEAMEDVLH